MEPSLLSVDVWVIVAPFLGSFAAFIACGIAYYPIWRKRQDAVDARNLRIDAACDAVLGKAIDPNAGRAAFEPGLVHILPLGNNSLLGVPTVMGQLAETKAKAAKAAASADAIHGRLERHINDDNRRFDEFDRRTNSGK